MVGKDETMFGRSYGRIAIARSFAVLAVVLLVAVAALRSTFADDNYKVVDGLAVYLDVLPAAMVKGHPSGHPEATMHGGAPGGAHEYHIVIAVFAAATAARVENANVTATISGLGHVGESSFDLEPMAVAGTVTYGGFVNLPGSDRYDIKVDIGVSGRNTPVQVDFTREHLGVQ